MGLIIALVVLALLVGGVGLVVEGLMWLLIIAGALVVASIVMGFLGRGRGAATK